MSEEMFSVGPIPNVEKPPRNADLCLEAEEADMSDILIVEPVNVDVELDRLAGQYRAAGGIGVQLLSTLGGRAESLIDRLPVPVRDHLTGATEQALTLAMQAAHSSRSTVPDQKPWVNTAVTTMMGAAGGFGGLPSALIELPATTTVLSCLHDRPTRKTFPPCTGFAQ